MKTRYIPKEKIIQAIIKNIKKNDSETTIETGLLNNYKTPKKIIWKSNKEGYQPDLKTSSVCGNTSLYEIELSNKIDQVKWRLFSLFAKINQGNFNVVIPEKNINIVENFIADTQFQEYQIAIHSKLI